MRSFIGEFLEETKKIGYLSDFDENGLDSVDHVLKGGPIPSDALQFFWDVLLWNSLQHFPDIHGMVT